MIKPQAKSVHIAALIALSALLAGLLWRTGARAQEVTAAPDAAPTAASAIYSFGTMQPTDAADPKDSLTYANGWFFGRASGTTAKNGGLGAIFHFGVTGDVPPQITGYAVDHFFTGPTTDGANPRHDAMTLVSTAQGDMLIGTTLAGGQYNHGSIFSIGDDATGYQELYSFHTKAGIQSHSCFVEEGGVLYGATAKGGANSQGVVFSVKPDGSKYKLLYSFQKSSGAQPHGRLTLSSAGDHLYGMTKEGGAANLGVIFKIDLTGSNYTALHVFSGGKKDGASTQHGYLVLDGSGSTLYGMTTKGGKHNKGVVFSIGTDGKNFTILHSFGSSKNDGQAPYGSLLLDGSTLYGTTSAGGVKKKGTVFEIGTNGKNYLWLHHFTGGNSDGSKPIDNVILVNGYLYGLTTGGGQYGAGTIFQIAAP